jgi:carboxypeptidase T
VRSLQMMLRSWVLCLIVVAASLAATAGKPVAQEPLLLVEVSLTSEADSGRLSAAGFDVAGINRRALTAQVVILPEERQHLESFGFATRLLDVGMPLRGRGEALSDYVSPQELSTFIDQTVAAHPDLAQKAVLRGTLFEGQQLVAVRITAGVTAPHDRPVFLLDAQHHAREVMTAEIAKDAIDYLTSRYGTDPEVTRWLDAIEVWVVACVNPDGAAYVFDHDSNWRKNRNPACAVDINRNYGWNWDACGGSSAGCRDETYHGVAPESEPETQGMVALVDRIRPLFSLSYHSYGEYLLYPFGCQDPDEMAVYGGLAQTLNGMLEDDGGTVGKYQTGPGWSAIYVTDGTSDDTFYGRYGAFCFVIEVNCCSFQPDYGSWRDITVLRQRTAWKYFLDQTLAHPSLQGTVRDAASGLPLAANVSLGEVAFTAGETPRRASATGRYGWVVEGGRTYHATFTMPGYLARTVAVEVGSGPAATDVTLVPVDSRLIPGAPAPGDAAAFVGVGETLNWSSEGAVSYDVYFGTTATPPFAGNTAQARFTPQGEVPGARYYWRVVAKTAGGDVPGPLWSFTTCPYAITSVKKLSSPFRLAVSGAGFAQGCRLFVDGVAAPGSSVKHEGRMVAGQGAALKALVPKGRSVQLQVRDGAGHPSPVYPFGY